MIQLFDYYYRRRYLDGASSIVHNSGSVLMRRDDAEVTILDFRFRFANQIGPYTGRRGVNPTTIATATATICAARLWLWWARPLRLYQFYDETNTLAIYRIDFATPPQRWEQACYQTDLYLDLFVNAAANDYAILDEDEVEIAQAVGLLDQARKTQIVDECTMFVELVEAGQLVSWLNVYWSQPFDLTILPAGWNWQHREVAQGKPDGWPF